VAAPSNVPIAFGCFVTAVLGLSLAEEMVICVCVCFKHLLKIAKSDSESHACLSVCLSAWNNSTPTGWIWIKFVLEFFETVPRKFEFH
jgi:hypothetical protein